MEEMKRNPRPANLRTCRTTPTEAVEEKKKNEFFSFHIGKTSFHAGDADGKISINLPGGLDVNYNATTTEEKKCDVEKEITNKIGALFETLKNITPPSTPTTDTPNATPTPSTSTAPRWDPWAYRPTCSQPGSGSEPKPITPTTHEPTENSKVVKKPPVAPASTNSTNNPNNPTENITREEYKRLLNSIYGMMEAIEQLKRAVEKLSIS